MSRPRLLIVVGPTCSGKSALAMALADRLGGIVINADAMQCYRELRILTARPTAADEARVPHALYGIRPAAQPANVAWWRQEALGLIGGSARLPILCGGTGMYIEALLHGLAEIPGPGDDARADARTLLRQIGPAALHARLAAADPATAARLRPSDSQRIARAWEVWRGTGRGLAAWQQDAAAPGLDCDARAVVLAPPRPSLRAAIAARWETMLAEGALDEVRALCALGLDPALPAMRAHGVREIAAVLDGTMGLAAASQAAQAQINQYTKRQTTWLRHHALTVSGQTFTIDARWSDTKQFSTDFMSDMMDFVSRRG